MVPVNSSVKSIFSLAQLACRTDTSGLFQWVWRMFWVLWQNVLDQELRFSEVRRHPVVIIARRWMAGDNAAAWVCVFVISLDSSVEDQLEPTSFKMATVKRTFILHVSDRVCLVVKPINVDGVVCRVQSGQPIRTQQRCVSVGLCSQLKGAFLDKERLQSCLWHNYRNHFQLKYSERAERFRWNLLRNELFTKLLNIKKQNKLKSENGSKKPKLAQTAFKPKISTIAQS